MGKINHIWILVLLFLISGCIIHESGPNLNKPPELTEINKDNYLDVARNILRTSNISFMESYQDRNCEIINGSEYDNGVFKLWVVCASGPHDCSFFLYNDSTVEDIGCAVPPEYPNMEVVMIDS